MEELLLTWYLACVVFGFANKFKRGLKARESDVDYLNTYRIALYTKGPF